MCHIDDLYTQAIYGLISPEIQPFPAEPGAYGISCDKINDLPAEITFAFTDEHGKTFELTIPTIELNVGPFASNQSICQTLINASDFGEIVGGSLLKHWYSVWDIGNQRIGFAPNGY